jgi:hypothetical protein
LVVPAVARGGEGGGFGSGESGRGGEPRSEGSGEGVRIFVLEETDGVWASEVDGGLAGGIGSEYG